jgi:endoglycosylceramidase
MRLASHHASHRTLLALYALCALGCTEDPPPEEAPAVVRVQDGRLVDPAGREVQLRGVNARVAGLFDVEFDDGRLPLQPLAAFTREDAVQMSEAGFNFLRLPINWSGLEPEEGNFSESYLRSIDDVLAHCRAAGLFVLLDFHQDAYSKHIGEDGAPLWAIEPAPSALLGGPLDEEELNRRRTSPAVLQAFTSFFENRERLQDRFLPVLRLIGSRYARHGEVIGIEIMNEPVSIIVDLTMEPLFAFYEKAVSALRAVNAHHPIWLEPDAIRNFTHVAPIRDEPFFADNIVYSPHLYPTLAGVSEEGRAAWMDALSTTFDRMVQEARSWGDAALVIGEWGADPREEETREYAAAFLALAEQRAMGHALWLWKERSQGSWGMFDYDDASETWLPRAQALEHFIAPYVQVGPGRMLAHSFDPQTRVLEARYQALGDERGEPELFLAPRRYPEGAKIFLDGEPAEAEAISAGRVRLRWRPRAGEVVIRVEPSDA